MSFGTLDSNIDQLDGFLQLRAYRRELGVDDLIKKLRDSAQLGTDNVKNYLSDYATKVEKAAATSDKIASDEVSALQNKIGSTKAEDITPSAYIRRLKRAWRQSYENQLEDINDVSPAAGTVLKKFLSNF